MREKHEAGKRMTLQTVLMAAFAVEGIDWGFGFDDESEEENGEERNGGDEVLSIGELLVFNYDCLPVTNACVSLLGYSLSSYLNIYTLGSSIN